MALALARWWTVLLGGVLLGAGLVLHGQVAFAQHLRAEVQGTFFLWRAVGQVTFVFQDDMTKAALSLNELPERVLVESDRAAWTLVAIGGIVALIGAMLRRRSPAKKRR